MYVIGSYLILTISKELINCNTLFQPTSHTYFSTYDSVSGEFTIKHVEGQCYKKLLVKSNVKGAVFEILLLWSFIVVYYIYEIGSFKTFTG